MGFEPTRENPKGDENSRNTRGKRSTRRRVRLADENLKLHKSSESALATTWLQVQQHGEMLSESCLSPILSASCSLPH